MLKKVDDWTYIRLGLLWILLATAAKCYQHLDEVQKKREIKDAENLELAQVMPVRDIKSHPGFQEFINSHPVYVVLTATPKRVEYLDKVWASIDTQWVKNIVLAIPETFARTGEKYSIPTKLLSQKKLKIVHSKKDYGPITKLIPAWNWIQKSDRDAIIIIIDDDYIYPKGMVVEHLYFLWQGQGKQASSAIVAKLGEESLMPHAYKVQSSYLEKLLPGQEVKLVHGVGSIGLLASMVDKKLIMDLHTYEESLGDNSCYLSDDAVISYMLQSQGISIASIQTDYLSHPILKPLNAVAEKDAIHNIPIWKGVQGWWKKKGPSPIEVRLDKCFANMSNYVSSH